MPQMKGQMKPMMNAIRVGSTNTGQYLLMAFCMIYLLKKKERRANTFARLPVQSSYCGTIGNA